ncbi:MinD/ParA family ATP-binding protein [Kitasatospora sp. NPDC054939]
MAAEERGARVLVHRLTEESGWALAPDYTPAEWPDPAPRADGAGPSGGGTGGGVTDGADSAGGTDGTDGVGTGTTGGAGTTGTTGGTVVCGPVRPPDWHRPLDAMGTVLVPPEARPGPAAAPQAVAPPAAPAVAVVPPRATVVAAVTRSVPLTPGVPATPAVPALPAAPAVAAVPTVPAVPAAKSEPGSRRRGPFGFPGLTGRAERTARTALTGGRRGGFGQAERDQRQLLAAVRAPLRGGVRVAVVGLKGGVGKTSAALGLGAVLAESRNDKVVAVDAVPGTGTLGRRIRRENLATTHDLLAAAPVITGYLDTRRFTSRTPSGLEVLAGVPGPAGVDGLGPDGYRRLIGVLERQYPFVVSDCGTGLLDDAARGVLDVTDQLVVAASTGVDGASSANTTLEWLYGNGYGALAARSITVVSGVREAGRTVGVDDLVGHFTGRCRAVVVVPYDEHLARGGEFDPARLRSRTHRAYLELAAAVTGGLSLLA